jgi:hypothetical protein
MFAEYFLTFLISSVLLVSENLVCCWSGGAHGTGYATFLTRPLLPVPQIRVWELVTESHFKMPSSLLLHCVVWQNVTEISDVLAAHHLDNGSSGYLQEG